MVRCKFECDLITEYTTGYTYSLRAVCGAPENKAYWEATPSGTLNLTIVKTKGKLFEVGKSYFIDISEAN
jgi:hypothetical protein